MAHLHKKVKKGKTYYYIREMARVDGKPKVVNQIYLGSVEKILSMVLNKEKAAIDKIQVQEFGSLFLANLVESKVRLVEIIDSVVSQDKKRKGPSIGEYFLYAVFNRMIHSKSKEALCKWYKKTAIHLIRPVDISALSSRNYWKKWDRVTKEDIEKISKLFFEKINEIEPINSDCFLFDTTNYYMYMDSKTPSELAVRGKNKEGKDWLRQIGLALLVSRESEIPFFYREYEGNCHDSRLFNRILKDIFSALNSLSFLDKELTIVFDKGMNSEANIAEIDKKAGIHFITSYSPHFAEYLISKDLSLFTPLSFSNNKRLLEEDQILAYRTTGEFWGRDRTVIVTYNPITASKQRYNFEKKLKRLQNHLFEIRAKVREDKRNFRDPKHIKKRYKDICESLYLPKNLYELDFFVENNQLKMRFRKNYHQISKYISRFGKNIIITDHHDWSTEEIVKAYLDRYQVEKAFRQSKAKEFGNMRPIYHWTDSKIRCHILCCIIALTYLRLLSLWIKKAGIMVSIDKIMESMRSLHSCLCWHSGKRKPIRIIEEPTPLQAEILSVFGYKIKGGVLQKISR
ncbi:IS1634 family transposase [Desulfonauticus submarinus]